MWIFYNIDYIDLGAYFEDESEYVKMFFFLSFRLKIDQYYICRHSSTFPS